MKLFILKICLFLILIGVLLYKLDPFFLDNKKWGVTTFNSFYEADKEELDIVFIGSSHLNRGVDTYIVDAICKTNSVKISSPGMTIAQMYYNLKEVLSKGKPELVVLETYVLIDTHGLNDNLFDKQKNLRVRPFNSEYNKRLGKVKYEEISKIYPDNTLFHIYNGFRFNDVWTDLDNLSASLKAKLSSDPKKINQERNRSLSVFSDDKIREYHKTDFSNEKIYISDDEKFFLDKIIKLSKANNLKILFYTVPVLDIYYKKTKKAFDRVSDELNSISENHKNIEFSNINKKVNGYDKTRFVNGNVSHNQHLNYKGIINTSNMLSKYIKNNYKFEAKSDPDLKSIEDILYKGGKIEKDPKIEGNIESINNFQYRIGDSLITTISIPKSQKKISIKGWMFHKNLNAKKTIRKLAFKKKNNFIMISQGDMQNLKNKSIARLFGENYNNSGFNFNFNRNSFEKGKYKIYGIVKSKKGDITIKDMWKWLIIK